MIEFKSGDVITNGTLTYVYIGYYKGEHYLKHKYSTQASPHRDVSEFQHEALTVSTEYDTCDIINVTFEGATSEYVKQGIATISYNPLDTGIVDLLRVLNAK
jgi:hypothetical protein